MGEEEGATTPARIQNEVVRVLATQEWVLLQLIALEGAQAPDRPVYVTR